MWWLLLLVPFFPTNEIPLMKKVEVFYPVEGEIVSYGFQDTLSPFVFVETQTNAKGISVFFQHVSLSNITIPSFEVVTLSDKKTNRLIFEGWLLRVSPTNVNLSNLHSVADIYPIQNFWWILWIVGAVLLVGGGMWFLYLRRKQETVSELQRVEDFQETLRRLWERLESLEEKTYYSEVAYFVRCMIEKVYGIPAREMGSSEIKEKLVVDKENMECFFDVLKWCDRVKYAKHTTSLEKRKQILQEVERLYNELLVTEENKQ